MHAAIDSLPDELVKDILSDILVVPDDEFSIVGSASGFGRNVVSSLQVLLVSKRWLRVATPLLYECIVLRSTPQAQAFQDALRGKAGAQLKRFVRRMRLDGCFRAVVDKIFNGLPGITDLFLKLPSNSEEKVNGFVKGLSKLRPTRVIFEFTGLSLWKNSFLMAEALCKALRNWETLIIRLRPDKLTFKLHVFPFHYKHGTKDDEITRLTRIGEALSDAPHLRLAILSFSDQRHYFTGGTSSVVVQFVKAIGKNSSLQSIHVLVNGQSTLNETLDGLLGDPCANIVQCSLIPARQLPRNNFDNIGRIPQLPEAITRSIIGMNLQAHLNPIALDTDWLEVIAYKMQCLTLFSVSKMFYKLALPLAFRIIFIQSPRSLILISKKLLGDTVLRHSVEAIKFSDVVQDDYDPTKDEKYDDHVEEAAKNIVKCLRNVRQISLSTKSAFVLDGMSEDSKLGLRKIHLKLTERRVNQKILSQFSNLITLALTSERFSTGLHVDSDAVMGRPCFQNVVSVRIFDLWNLDTIHILQSCDFPSAQSIEVVLPEDNIVPSTELQSEALPIFPKLQYISITGILQGAYSQLLRAEQCPVEKIVLHSGYLERHLLRCENAYMSVTFDSIDFGNLKALKELQIASVDEWPWQDRELKNSAWQKRAQDLVNAYGFKITNASGIPWKPRLLQRTKGR